MPIEFEQSIDEWNDWMVVTFLKNHSHKHMRAPIPKHIALNEKKWKRKYEAPICMHKGNFILMYIGKIWFMSKRKQKKNMN